MNKLHYLAYFVPADSLQYVIVRNLIISLKLSAKNLVIEQIKVKKKIIIPSIF